MYDVRVQRELASFRGHNRDVISAAWHPLHEDLFVSGGYDGSLIFWLAGRQAPQVSPPPTLPRKSQQIRDERPGSPRCTAVAVLGLDCLRLGIFPPTC